MKVWAIVPAAGEGRRMGGGVPKPFLALKGIPILAITLGNLMRCPRIEHLLVCLRAGDLDRAKEEVGPHLPSLEKIQWVVGGERRQDSVYKALQEVAAHVDLVLIHDGVRPFVSLPLVETAISETERWGATVLGLPIRETVKAVDPEGLIVRTVARDPLWTVQTPQTFRKNLILEAHECARREGFEGTDDASLLERNDCKVKVLLGSAENIKITTPEDLPLAEKIMARGDLHSFKIGLGYDIHALIPERPLILGGVRVPYDKGLSGDSDADVLVHAIIDAILGAAGEGDIGLFFGVGKPELMGASSLHLLGQVRERMERIGTAINNIDATIIAQAPRLSPYIEAMRVNVGETLRMDISHINIKSTTAKGLGAIGAGEGISAQVVVSAILRTPPAGPVRGELS